MNNFIYIKSKGLFYFVEGNNSLIINYLLNKDCNNITYIERTKIKELITILNNCHINYYLDKHYTFNDNKYSNYLEYGYIYLKIFKLTKKLKELIYLDNISSILDEMDNLL